MNDLTNPTDPNRRAILRARTFWKGTILFPGGLRSVECTVRNFSSGGARLDCGAISDLPDHFRLNIPQKGATFDCAVMWRRLPEVGVAFREAQTDSATELIERMRELEAQNRRLVRKLSERDPD